MYILFEYHISNVVVTPEINHLTIYYISHKRYPKKWTFYKF